MFFFDRVHLVYGFFFQIHAVAIIAIKDFLIFSLSVSSIHCRLYHKPNFQSPLAFYTIRMLVLFNHGFGGEFPVNYLNNFLLMMDINTILIFVIFGEYILKDNCLLFLLKRSARSLPRFFPICHFN